MKRPEGWSLYWLLWLGAVLLDAVAAVGERAKPGRIFTLSRHIWAYFPMGWRRSVLAAFLAAVGAHLVLEASAWWLLTAIPFALVIVDAVWWRSEPGAMTREAWDAEWKGALARIRAKEPTMPLAQANTLAVTITTARYGARPAGLPIWLKLAQGFISRKLTGLRSVEVSPMLQRVIVAVTYGIGAGASVLSAAFQDGKIESGEWTALATAFLLAFWGTFKSNTTVIAPNRTEWTPEERKVETAKMDAGVLVQDAKVIAEKKVEDAKVPSR